jgi:hypothetical protein
MRKYLILVGLICIVSSFLPFEAHALFKSTKVTLVVVDEEGSPLEGVDAGVAFERNTGWGTDVTPQDKFTGGDGKATFTGQSNGHIAYGAEKEGYYPSYYDYDFKDLGTFGWEPWNPELKVVMRKVENPVPMYARNAGMEREIEVPVLNKDIGFDLVVSDWVAPYGMGKTSDFIFNLRKNYSGPTNFETALTLEFSNEKDGIINVKEDLQEGSTFKLPRYAPRSGYKNSINFHLSRKGGKLRKSYNQNDSYLFRVRSQKQDNEEVKALYGKLGGAIVVSGFSDVKPIITFKYYLNPDGTRNLEFDPDRNLFSNLPILEQVKEP